MSEINAALFRQLSSGAMFPLMELTQQDATEARVNAQMGLATALSQAAMAWERVDSPDARTTRI